MIHSCIQHHQIVTLVTTAWACHTVIVYCATCVCFVAAGCIPDHISTFAGYGQQAFIGDNAPASSAGLYFPTGLALDVNGSVYIADSGQHRIRRVDAETGIITTVAGVGSPGSSGDQGPAIAAQLNTPTSVTFDPTGAMYITEALGNRIRRCVTHSVWYACLPLVLGT
jgi:streptogramin lyase